MYFEPVTGANIKFGTAYFLLTGSTTFSFDYRANSASHGIKYAILLYDTTGAIIDSSGCYAGGCMNGASLSTESRTFNRNGWFKVEFRFERTGSGGSNPVLMLDSFRANVTSTASFLLDLDLDCNSSNVRGNNGNLDTFSYNTILVNNGPDTLFNNTASRILISYPISPPLNFDLINTPPNTSLDTATGSPNTAFWVINKIEVGQTLTLELQSYYSSPMIPFITLATSEVNDFIGSEIVDPISGNNFTSCPAMLLPITMLEFTANIEHNKPTLRWTTISEINNMGFEVYSSTDRINWNYLGFVDGIGNSNEYVNYQFIDSDNLLPITFYKLIQVDYDGKTEEFGPVRINIDNHLLASNIIVFPNPSSNGVVKIEFISNTLSNISNTEVNVYSITGQIVHQVSLDFTSTTLQSIDLSHLPKGQYILKLSNNKQVHTVKIILE